MHALRLLPKLKRQVLIGDVLGDVSQPWPVQPLILRRERAVLHAFVTQDRARRVAAMKLRAPELTGRGWLNTGGADITLTSLRGKVVVLDFWTFCCVNCLHVLDELRPLEEKYGDQLVLIGVHSPKFEHEADRDALEAAVERYAVHHPVLDDPDLTTWQAYAARAWPTLVVLDPEGYIVASMSGEGHAHGLSVLIDDLIAEHTTKGTLRRGDGPYVAPPAPETLLRFPGKVITAPARPVQAQPTGRQSADDAASSAGAGEHLTSGGFFVSDTAHHQVVHLAEDGETELARYGGPGVFNEPQGLLLLPEEARARTGDDLLVADSVNHEIKAIRLSDGRIRTVAGTGEQLRERDGGGPALRQALSTPWDLAWWHDRVIIAMAGTHQLWALHLGESPELNTVAVLAGTSNEGIRDGAAHDAWFAQPGGLATSADGSHVWVADSETSALRSLSVSDEGFEVTTHVGQGLFDFGHVDGAADAALLQHPLGVTELPDGSVAVADTYNGAIRRFDPSSGEVTTLATGLAEPSDVIVVPGEVDADAHLLVVESNAHRLTPVALTAEAQRIEGDAQQTQRPPSEIASGAVELVVTFTPPAGQKLDHRYGDPTMLQVSSSPEAFLRDGAGKQQGLTRTLTIDESVGSAILHVSVRAAACDGDPDTGEVPEHAACHLYQQDWGIPLVITGDGPRTLTLDLRGV